MMIVQRDDMVEVTLLLSQPKNVFQEELLIDTLKELSEVNKHYQEQFNEYE